MPFGRRSPLEALALPGAILAYKYSQFRQRRREAANRRVTERELSALHHKIVSLPYNPFPTSSNLSKKHVYNFRTNRLRPIIYHYTIVIDLMILSTPFANFPVTKAGCGLEAFRAFTCVRQNIIESITI
ncbi:Histone domain-containing protein [Sergentomyia squamirostris]